MTLANHHHASSPATKASHAVKPKRPLSSYNLFYKFDRERLLANKPNLQATVDHVRRLSVQDKCKTQEKRIHRKTHGKISFVELSKMISTRWNELDDTSKKIFEDQAVEEKEVYDDKVREFKYQQELEHWKKINAQKNLVFQQGGAAGLVQQNAGQVNPMNPHLPHVSQMATSSGMFPRHNGNMMVPYQQHNVDTDNQLQQFRHRIDSALAGLGSASNVLFPPSNGFSTSSGGGAQQQVVGGPHNSCVMPNNNNNNTNNNMLPNSNRADPYRHQDTFYMNNLSASNNFFTTTMPPQQEYAMQQLGFESTTPLDALDMDALFD